MLTISYADLLVALLVLAVIGWLTWLAMPPLMWGEMKIRRTDAGLQARHLLMTLQHAESLDVDMEVFAGTAQGPRAVVGLTFARLGAERVLLLDCKEEA